MTFYVTDQNTVVFAFAVFGAIAGVLRDITVVKRQIMPTGAILRFIEDILYCMLLTALYHVLAFVVNYGYVRWYEFASAFIGFLLYRKIFGSVLRKLLYNFASAVIKMFGLVLKPLVSVLVKMSALINTCSAGVRIYIYGKRLSLKSVVICRKSLAAAKNGF